MTSKIISIPLQQKLEFEEKHRIIFFFFDTKPQRDILNEKSTEA